MPRWSMWIIAGLLGLIALSAQAQLPKTQCISTAIGGGSGDAVTIPLLPCSETTTLLVLTFTAPNTITNPTISVNGQTPHVILNFDATALTVGELAPSQRRILTYDGANWLLLSGGTAGGGGGITLCGSTPWDGADLVWQASGTDYCPDSRIYGLSVPTGAGAGNGSPVTLLGGSADQTSVVGGNGGAVNITGGQSSPSNVGGADGLGGAVNINGGIGSGEDGGGVVTIAGGAGVVYNYAGPPGGAVIISGGDAETPSTNQGGTVRISGGASYGTGTAGDVILLAGSALNLGGGNVTVIGGGTSGLSQYPELTQGNIVLNPGQDGSGNFGVIVLQNLPTADPGISGALWNSSGTLKISP